MPFFCYDIDEGYLTELLELKGGRQQAKLVSMSCRGGPEADPDDDWLYMYDASSEAMVVESRLELKRINVGAFIHNEWEYLSVKLNMAQKIVSIRAFVLSNDIRFGMEDQFLLLSLQIDDYLKVSVKDSLLKVSHEQPDDNPLKGDKKSFDIKKVYVVVPAWRYVNGHAQLHFLS